MDVTNLHPGAPPVRPKNWLVESILVTILCCLPFGIVGIIYAAGVNAKYDAGLYADALESSRQAGKWTKIGFFVGLLLGFLGIIFYVIMFMIIGANSFM